MQFRHLTAAIVAAILEFTSNAAPVAPTKAIPFDENYSSTLGTFVAVAANAEATNAPLVPTTASFATLVTKKLRRLWPTWMHGYLKRTGHKRNPSSPPLRPL
jgi:hypothetical protein